MHARPICRARRLPQDEARAELRAKAADVGAKANLVVAELDEAKRKAEAFLERLRQEKAASVRSAKANRSLLFGGVAVTLMGVAVCLLCPQFVVGGAIAAGVHAIVGVGAGAAWRAAAEDVAALTKADKVTAAIIPDIDAAKEAVTKTSRDVSALMQEVNTRLSARTALRAFAEDPPSMHKDVVKAARSIGIDPIAAIAAAAAPA